MISPIFNPLHFYLGVTGYFWYIRDIIKYNQIAKKRIIFDTNLFPILTEKVSFTPFDAHYFYQQLWVFENVLKQRPKKHIDVASTYEMSGYLSKIVKTTFVDIRPIKTSLKNLEIKNGDILDLPYKDNSIESLSSLHVVEHIGLGRYGDPLDPEGTKKACQELARILAKNGRLYLSTPVGKERLCFNSHRITPPEEILKYCKNLKLISFSVVDDNGIFHEDTNYKDHNKSTYACGMFLFTKK
jgi:SAM-dependent methyltransferase